MACGAGKGAHKVSDMLAEPVPAVLSRFLVIWKVKNYLVVLWRCTSGWRHAEFADEDFAEFAKLDVHDYLEDESLSSEHVNSLLWISLSRSVIF